MHKSFLKNLVLKRKSLDLRSFYKMLQLSKIRQVTLILIWKNTPDTLLNYLLIIETLAVWFSTAILTTEAFINQNKNVLKRKKLKFLSPSSSSIEYLSSEIFKLNLRLSIHNLILYLTDQHNKFRNPQIITKNPDKLTLLKR